MSTRFMRLLLRSLRKSPPRGTGQSLTRRGADKRRPYLPDLALGPRQ